MASMRAPWPAHGRGTPSAALINPGSGDLASEIQRLRGAARFHSQELSELDGRAHSIAIRGRRLDASLGRLSAAMLGSSLPAVAAGVLLHLANLLQAGMLLTTLGTLGTCLWTLTRQSLKTQGRRLAHERRAARERADHCERLALALEPGAAVPRPLEDNESTDEITQKTQLS